MSIHSSFKTADTMKRHRSVLTRLERVRILQEKGFLDLEKSSILGLPKVKHLRIRMKKEKAAAAAPGTEGAAAAPGDAKAAAPAGAAGAKPAAGGKGAAPAAGKAGGAAPKAGGAAAKPEGGAGSAKKKE